MHREIMRKAEMVAVDYKAAFRDDLISVTLYGSAMTAEYDPKKSDFNFLVVLSEKGMEQLHLAHELVAKWRKKKVSTPLFLTKASIASSLDTFPIEFLNITLNYRVIAGQDVLKGITFKKHFIRMQCERELKGKLLLLRERYVETRGKPTVISKLISASVPTFIFVFKGLLFLLDKEIPETRQETVAALAQELDLNKELFSSLLEIEAGSLKPPKHEIQEIFKRYLKQIHTLALLMDERDFGVPPDLRHHQGGHGTQD